MRGTSSVSRRTAGGLAAATAAAGAVALFGLTSVSSAQSKTDTDYLPAATLVEVMNSMAMPFAQVIWEAVVYGDTIEGPDTEEGWQQVRHAAVALAETANVLMVPGRPIAGPDKVTSEGELAPEEMENLIAENREAWVGHAHALHEVATQAIQAVDARDAMKLSDVGGAMNSVCGGCHMQFWYPNQQ